MTARTQVHGLQVANELHSFINQQVLPGTGVDPAAFWQGFDAIVADLAPKNAALLAERDGAEAAIGAEVKPKGGAAPAKGSKKSA